MVKQKIFTTFRFILLQQKQMSEADVTSPAIEKVESERLYELEMDDFLGTLYLQPTGQKRSSKTHSNDAHFQLANFSNSIKNL